MASLSSTKEFEAEKFISQSSWRGTYHNLRGYEGRAERRQRAAVEPGFYMPLLGSTGGVFEVPTEARLVN